jgi:hypothetical protein
MATKDETRSNDTRKARGAIVDMMLEIVIIPVSDADRSKEFYTRLGGGWTPTSPAVTTSE